MKTKTEIERYLQYLENHLDALCRSNQRTLSENINIIITRTRIETLKWILQD